MPLIPRLQLFGILRAEKYSADAGDVGHTNYLLEIIIYARLLREFPDAFLLS